MEIKDMLYEGKAKRVYKTDDAEVVFVDYKDEATAFNGEKKAVITGKGRLNNAISSILFQKLAQAGIANHFVKKVSETGQLVKSVKIIPIEVVVRNVTAGTLAKRIGMNEGITLRKPILEFYYKRDDLGDPLINEDHIHELQIAEASQLQTMRDIAFRVNQILIDYFKARKVNLIDFKLEFGCLNDGTVILADEISPDTCRLWDLETNQKLDKDVFRRDLGDLTTVYDELLKRLEDAQ